MGGEGFGKAGGASVEAMRAVFAIIAWFIQWYPLFTGLSINPKQGVSVEVVGMATDAPPPSGKGIRDRAFGWYGVPTLVVEILLEVGESDMGRGAELTVVIADTDVQECDMGGWGVLGKVVVIYKFLDVSITTVFGAYTK